MSQTKELRRIRKSGHLTIPKSIREQLDISDGDVLMIMEQPLGLVMKPINEEHIFNESIVSNNGKVNIPIEIRRNLNINEETHFSVRLDKERSAVILEILEEETG
ncbi:AbrB/MazE/SpoVT family DNA-binding domain-containing protein [Bacillus sp. RO1]|uniref:AbrB/MazE/SpoVT family DNA-binding domain-containing protein n=1 Tax=Bacillus sp. RO1 TaxID=2722703 RepID=UPI00145723C7|nr:AbrB/MazE/SpoVT family DNA-binding domain-containing protein [Bacillus sp. RO1]NLP50672.1 AbrB/MazE/SpoVT family DNA-binding domain-containing protein [Bacillus sp. RO1]